MVSSALGSGQTIYQKPRLIWTSELLKDLYRMYHRAFNLGRVCHGTCATVGCSDRSRCSDWCLGHADRCSELRGVQTDLRDLYGMKCGTIISVWRDFWIWIMRLAFERQGCTCCATTGIFVWFPWNDILATHPTEHPKLPEFYSFQKQFTNTGLYKCVIITKYWHMNRRHCIQTDFKKNWNVYELFTVKVMKIENSLSVTVSIPGEKILYCCKEAWMSDFFTTEPTQDYSKSHGARVGN